MKLQLLKVSIFCLVFALMGVGCQDEDELVTYQASGEIVLVTGMCYGEAVIIEVDSPAGIGEEGAFAFVGDTNIIEYKNAISVPVFSKIPEIPDSIIPNVGLYLDFEYRELTEEERTSNLFRDDILTNPCLSIYGPPNANQFMITKITNLK